MDELWAPIQQWDGYQVSSYGRLKGKRGDHLRGYIDRSGYHCCYIGPRKQGKGIKVHRAVVEAFIGPIIHPLQVNHKNGIRTDNRVENLEIVTISQNVKHSFDVLGKKVVIGYRAKGSDHHHSHLTKDQVIQIRQLYKEGHTQVALGKLFNTNQANISAIIRRVAWKHVTD